MKKEVLFGLIVAFTFVSCGGGEEEATTEGAPSDSTEVSEEGMEEETEEAFRFDGEERGDFALYGFEEVDESEAVNMAEFNASLKADKEFTGTVSVNVEEVCKKAGCWITFKQDALDDESVRVYFTDHFGIPTETATGTHAILKGSTSWDTTSVEMQKHLLDDRAEAGEEVPQKEYDKIKRDIVELVFNCDAILVAKN